MKPMFADNGPEPAEGSWVIASESNEEFGCPDRVPWQRRGNDWWVDPHGCSRKWKRLGDPVDCLPPSEWADA